MPQINVLIVEDDSEIVNRYKRLLDSRPDKDEYPVELFSAKNITEARKLLDNANNVYDAAIIDIKLSSGTDHETNNGNVIIKFLQDETRIPIFSVTGTPEDVDHSFKRSLCFSVINRAEDGDLFDKIINLYKTGVTRILSRKGTIEQKLNEIFWSNLSVQLNNWIDDESRNTEAKEKSLLRYTLLHIMEHLELATESDFEHYHPAEIYISPVIKSMHFTGDILKKKSDGKMFIILTPSCDMAQGKAKNVVLAEIESHSEGVLNDNINLGKKTSEDASKKKKINEAKDILTKIISNSYSNRYHYLPKVHGVEGGLINFQKLLSEKYNELDSKFERIASINSSFAKDIIARFSAYYARQGAPDLEAEKIRDMLL